MIARRPPALRSALAAALASALGLALAASALGCFTTGIRRTGSDRTATEQLLVSTAVDRAVSKLRFPNVEGRTVAVEISALNEGDAHYLRSALETRARKHGARVVPADEAERVILARAGTIGTDRRDTTFGLPSIPTPFGTTPAINVLEYMRQEGKAKLALATRDGRGWHRTASRTVRGHADVRIFVLLFARLQLDDVSKDPADPEGRSGQG